MGVKARATMKVAVYDEADEVAKLRATWAEKIAAERKEDAERQAKIKAEAEAKIRQNRKTASEAAQKLQEDQEVVHRMGQPKQEKQEDSSPDTLIAMTDEADNIEDDVNDVNFTQEEEEAERVALKEAPPKLAKSIAEACGELLKL